jgi:hypothetical protein
MARPEDIRDASLRTALLEAEERLNEGDYAAVVRKCAYAYLALLARRPDLTPPPTPPDGQHFFGFGGPGAGGQDAAGRPLRRVMWPAFGTRFLVGEDQRPSVVFDKERFSMSEAATYFEFTMDQVIRAQRE